MELGATVFSPVEPGSNQPAAGRFPVVLDFSPYGRVGPPRQLNEYLVQRGYIYVLVDVRGTGRSGGEMEFRGPLDAADGKALVDWAAHQLEGSDGRVAFAGCSYPAGMALLTASVVGPNSPLKVIVASCNGLLPPIRESWMNGGVPTTGFWNYTTGMSTRGSNGQRRVVAWIQDQIANGLDPAYEGEYWGARIKMDMAAPIHQNGIPILLWTGWGDITVASTIRTYAALQNAFAGRPIHAPMVPGQRTTPRYQIIVGGWGHAEGLDDGVYLQWLETWLKGIDTGIQNTRTPAHIFEVGSNRWVNADRFNLVSEYTPWRLGSGGVLTTGNVPSGEARLNWGSPDAADGRLQFHTQPIADGLTLAGPVSASIFARSSNTNLEIIASLFDVALDGTAERIGRGVVLGSQRELDAEKSWPDARGTFSWPWPRLREDSYLTPGQTYRFDIAFGARQHAVKPGHRLRLELVTQTSTDLCPEVETPRSNGSEPCRLTKPQQATVPGGRYQILFGEPSPSAINLPQMRYGALTAVPGGSTPTAAEASVQRGLTLPMDWGN